MEISDKVCAVLSELSGAENVTPEMELRSDLGLDSLQMVTLLVMLEDTFGITLEESDMDPFDLADVRQVVTLVGKYTGGGGPDDHEPAH